MGSTCDANSAYKITSSVSCAYVDEYFFTKSLNFCLLFLLYAWKVSTQVTASCLGIFIYLCLLTLEFKDVSILKVGYDYELIVKYLLKIYQLD